MPYMSLPLVNVTIRADLCDPEAYNHVGMASKLLLYSGSKYLCKSQMQLCTVGYSIHVVV